MSTKGREKLIAETTEQMEKSGTGLSMEKLMEHVRTTGDINKLQNLNMQAQRMADINRSLAVSKVDALIDKSTKMGSPLAKAYMTGITVQDTYDEAKSAGASDLEAALPEAIKTEVAADELPTPEEAKMEDAAENKEEKEKEETKESLKESRELDHITYMREKAAKKG
jgi:hypothetical protein